MHTNTSSTQKGPDYVTLCAFDFKRRVKCERQTVASNLKGATTNLASGRPSFNRAIATRDDMNVATMK